MTSDIGEVDVRRLKLNPGDKIVLTTTRKLSHDDIKALKRQAEAVFAPWPVVVLSHDFEIAVVESPSND